MIWKRGLPKNFGKSIDFCNVSKNRLFTAMELTHASLLCDEDMKIFVYHFWGWLGAMLKNLHGEKHHYLLNQWTTQRVIGHWYPCLIQLSGRFDPNCPCAGSCCSISNWSASSDTINCNGRLINVVSFVFFDCLRIIASLTAPSCPVISWSTTPLFHDKRGMISS